jgi:hypothetical protein
MVQADPRSATEQVGDVARIRGLIAVPDAHARRVDAGRFEDVELIQTGA